VVASGSLPPGVPEDLYARVAGVADRLGASFVLDTSGSALRVALGRGVYLFKPNLRELCELTGALLEGEADMLATCRELVHGGRAEIVALSLGHRGAILVTRELALRAEALPVKVVSTVGAGDSFLGGLVWKLAAGGALDDAFRVAVAAGAAALLRPGTELCTREDVERLLPQVKIAPL
jgi:6-phosphofructokinase 2